MIAVAYFATGIAAYWLARLCGMPSIGSRASESEDACVRLLLFLLWPLGLAALAMAGVAWALKRVMP